MRAWAGDHDTEGAHMRAAFVLTEDEDAMVMDYVWDLYECRGWRDCIPWGETTCSFTARYEFAYTRALEDDITPERPTN